MIIPIRKTRKKEKIPAMYIVGHSAGSWQNIAGMRIPCRERYSMV